MALAIETKGYTKTYRLLMPRRLVNAVENLDLQVEEGEIYGFLGPNGAGKTTTIKMLLGLTYPTAGEGWVLGKPAGDIEVKRQVSYLPESPYFYEYMSGQEVLDFYARLFGLDARTRQKRVEELLKRVGLYGDRHKPLSQYSKGMLQRIGIAQALVNDPKLLFFDEPTSGLDPIAHIEIRDLILELKHQGKTVFLSSHQLSDVEMVCDRISILNHGRLLKTGILKELLAHGRVEIQVQGLDKAAIAKLRESTPDIRTDNGTAIIYEEAGERVDALIDKIRAANGRILSVIPQRRTLEELFLETIREGNA